MYPSTTSTSYRPYVPQASYRAYRPPPPPNAAESFYEFKDTTPNVPDEIIKFTKAATATDPPQYDVAAFLRETKTMVTVKIPDAPPSASGTGSPPPFHPWMKDGNEFELKQDEFVQKMINHIAFVNHGVDGVQVIAVIHNDTKKAAFLPLNLAYRAILGTKYPFRRISLTNVFDKILEKEFTAVIIGTRFPDDRKSIVQTFIYSTDVEVRVALAKLKPQLDPHIPITFISKIDEVCKTGCDVRAKELDCISRDLYETLTKTLRVPSEEGAISRIIGHLHEEILAYKKTLSTSTVFRAGFYVVKPTSSASTSGCPNKVNLTKLKLLDPNQDVPSEHPNDAFLALVFEHAFMQFLCWLCSGTPSLSKNGLKTWEFPLMMPNIELAYGPRKVFSSKTGGELTQQYFDEVKVVLDILKQIVAYLFQDNDKEKTCLPALYCAKSDFTDLIDKVLDYYKDKTKTPFSSEDLCAVTELRSRLLMVTNRLVEFFAVIQEAATQVQLKFTNVNDAHCKFMTRVIPWFHLRSQQIEMFYQGIKIKETSCATPCSTRITIPSPIIALERLRIQLMKYIPQAFGEKSIKPDKDVLMRMIQEDPNGPHVVLAKEYLSLQTSLDLQTRMAEAGITRHELCQSETDIADLLSWSMQSNLIHEVSRHGAGLWVRGLYEKFTSNMGQTDGKLYPRLMEKRKADENVARQGLTEVMAKLRAVMTQVANILMQFGLNPLVDEILGSSNPEALRGLAALAALKNENNNNVVCAVAREVNRCGSIALPSITEALSSISRAYAAAPSGPLGRSADVDMASYPASQSVILGALDGNYYVPYYKDNLETDYFRIS